MGPIINLARTLGLSTIAEGVELPGQATLLIEQGCDAAQGYLWSRPLPAADVWALTQDALQPKVDVGA